MKLIFRILFIFLSVLMGSCTSDQQQFVRESQNEDYNNRLIYLIDGKQANKPEVIRQNDAGNIDLIEFAPDSRSALLKYGEKFRHGVYIFVTNNKEKK